MSTVGAPGASTPPTNSTFVENNGVAALLGNSQEIPRVDSFSRTNNDGVFFSDVLLSKASSIFGDVTRLFSKIDDKDFEVYANLFTKPAQERKLKLTIVQLAMGQTVNANEIQNLKKALEAELKSETSFGATFSNLVTKTGIFRTGTETSSSQGKKLFDVAKRVLRKKELPTNVEEIIKLLQELGQGTKQSITEARQGLLRQTYFNIGGGNYSLSSYLKGLYSGGQEEKLASLFSSETKDKKANDITGVKTTQEGRFPLIKEIIGNQTANLDSFIDGDLQKGEWETLESNLKDEINKEIQKLNQKPSTSNEKQTSSNKEFAALLANPEAQNLRLLYSKYLLVLKAQSAEEYLVNGSYTLNTESNGIKVTNDKYPLKEDLLFKGFTDITKEIEDDYNTEISEIQKNNSNNESVKKINNVFKQIYNVSIPADPIKALQVEIIVNVLDNAVGAVLTERLRKVANLRKDQSKEDTVSVALAAITSGTSTITKFLKDGLKTKSAEASGIFSAAIENLRSSAIPSGGGR